MLDLLIDLGWKSALIAGVALSVSHGVRGLAASERVMVLRAGIAALLMLPLFAVAMPALELAVLPAQQAASAVDPLAPGGPVSAPEPDGPAGLMLWLYGAGAALALLHLIAGVLTLRRWTRAAAPPLEARWVEALASAAASLRRPVRLLVSPRVPGPLSWGIAPAWLLIGPDLAKRPEQAEAVIAHELAHVRRFDWPVLIAARIVVALYWFNPLVWLLARTLAHQTELAADDDAIQHMTQADYAQTLLTVASPAVPAAACGMTVSRSMLASRIRRILETRAHRPASRWLGGVLLLAAPGTVAPLAAMQFVPAVASPAVETGPAVPPRPDLPTPGAKLAARESAALPVPSRAAILRDRSAEAQPSRARASAVNGAQGARHQTPTRERIALETPQPHEASARYSRSGPEMVEKRATALRLSDSANAMRAEADRVEADIRKRDVSREERSGTLAGVRAMRAEAERRDQEARQLIFGR